MEYNPEIDSLKSEIAAYAQENKELRQEIRELNELLSILSKENTRLKKYYHTDYVPGDKVIFIPTNEVNIVNVVTPEYVFICSDLENYKDKFGTPVPRENIKKI